MKQKTTQTIIKSFIAAVTIYLASSLGITWTTYANSNSAGALNERNHAQITDLNEMLQEPSKNNAIAGATSEWPQVQNDPEHTGLYGGSLGTNFRVSWTHPFQPEKVFPQAQAIISAGKVFVGTENGNLYAFNETTGQQAWKFTVNSPILNSVAVASNRVYFGSMNGNVYAVDAGTGAQAWSKNLSSRLGFSTAPVIAEGKLMLGGRNGIFYALDLNDGHILWQYSLPTGSAILQTAAYNVNTSDHIGRVFFGAMDMYVYALNASSGSLSWRSAKIPEMAFNDYWPLVDASLGKVIVRPVTRESVFENTGFPNVGFPFVFLWDSSDPGWDWVMQNGPMVAQGNLTNVSSAMQAQQNALNYYDSHPGSFPKSFFVLDETTGNESTVVPHWTGQTQHGATTPPCLDNAGNLIVPIYFIRSGWARLNLGTRLVTDILYDHKGRDGNALQRGDYPAGMGNQDENLNVTCSANLILSMHTQEGNANYTGAFDLVNRRWISIPAGQTSQQLSTNTQGGGGNPVSIADGLIFHISMDELIVRSTR